MKNVKLVVINSVQGADGVEHFAFDVDGNRYRWEGVRFGIGAWQRMECLGVLNAESQLLPGESVEVSAPLSDSHVARLIEEAKKE